MRDPVGGGHFIESIAWRGEQGAEQQQRKNECQYGFLHGFQPPDGYVFLTLDLPVLEDSKPTSAGIIRSQKKKFIEQEFFEYLRRIFYDGEEYDVSRL
jgi:hypothetical protein